MAVEEVQVSEGQHNASLPEQRIRLLRQGLWKNQATMQVTTTKGMAHIEAFTSWFGMRVPMGQRLGRTFIQANSTAAGYNEAVKDALCEVPDVPWVNFLFIEDDVIVPTDTVVRLIAALERGYDAAGALCWTREPNGTPLILGNPDDPQSGMLPQIPIDGQLQHVNALHLGCTMVRAAVFRDKRWGKVPWFWEGGASDDPMTAQNVTADVAFFHRFGQLGYSVVCDTGLHVGHRDPRSGKVY